MNETKSKDLINDLVDSGMTKWEMSKRLGVTWNTLNNWHMGRYEPLPENMEELKRLHKDPDNYKKGE